MLSTKEVIDALKKMGREMRRCPSPSSVYHNKEESFFKTKRKEKALRVEEYRERLEVCEVDEISIFDE